MEVISVLAVEEFETPRIQASINERNDRLIRLFSRILTYYEPEVAIRILAEVAENIIEENKGLYERLTNIYSVQEYVT